MSCLFCALGSLALISCQAN